MPDREKLSRKTREAFNAARYASLGLELGISVAIGLLGGRWLDGRFETTPWLMLLGMVLGLTAGIRSIYTTLTRAQRASEREAEDEREPPAEP